MSDSSKFAGVSRVKRSTPLGTAFFVGMRALDVALQYYFIKQGGAGRIISWFGLQAILIANTSYADILVGLPALGSVKQILWIYGISEGEMPISQALQIGTIEIITSSISAFTASWATSSLASYSNLLRPNATVVEELLTSPLLFAAVVLSTVGILIETISELQRKRFKDDRNNKGKPYSGGLSSLVRHPNYAGYVVWRTANAMAAGGVASASVVFALLTFHFASSGIPALDAVSLCLILESSLANNPRSTVI